MPRWTILDESMQIPPRKNRTDESLRINTENNVRPTSSLLSVMRTSDAETANGAVTHSTTQNNCLDLFFLAGASRTMSEEDIKKLFSKAFNEDRITALKILFWARDVRKGAGERRFFRTCLSYLSIYEREVLAKITKYIPDFGRWDDILCGDADEATKAIKFALERSDALCAKWMPREKSAQSTLAIALRRRLHLSSKEYRQMLSSLSNTVEQDMTEKKWNTINYQHVPSIAFNKYRKAFYRNDETRFSAFIEEAKKGKVKINAGAIYPQNLYDSWSNARNENLESIDAQWRNLPSYGNNESIIPVCDVSGSMRGLPLSVSVSLGVYLSERNRGIFRDSFITFSTEPELEVLNGTPTQRFAQLEQAHWNMSTDLNEVFLLILNKAKEGRVPESDMPKKILIISDMEFNRCSHINTNHEEIKRLYEESGYEMPQLVYWNVNGRTGNVPVNVNDNRTALVSGFSPSILTSVLGGKDLTPLGVLMDTIQKERYSFIERL